MTAESTPTWIRASVMGVMSLVGMVGTGFSWIFNAAMTSVAGTERLGLILMLCYLPVLIISVVLLQLKVKETKGVELDSIEE